MSSEQLPADDQYLAGFADALASAPITCAGCALKEAEIATLRERNVMLETANQLNKETIAAMQSGK